MAAANNHRVMFVLASPTSETPDAADTTSGTIWLFNRNDKPVPVEAGAVVMSPSGLLPLESGAKIHTWSNETVNVETIDGDSVATYVTPTLFANAGALEIPLDFLTVDGWDGTYYVWQIVYEHADGLRKRTAEGYGQLSSSIDYETAGSVGAQQGDGSYPVFADALDVNMLRSSRVESLIASIVATQTVAAEVVSDAAYTLTTADHLKMKKFTAASATVTVPTGLGANFECICVGHGAAGLTLDVSAVTAPGNTSVDQYQGIGIKSDAADTFTLLGGTSA